MHAKLFTSCIFCPDLCEHTVLSIHFWQYYKHNKMGRWTEACFIWTYIDFLPGPSIIEEAGMFQEESAAETEGLLIQVTAGSCWVCVIWHLGKSIVTVQKFLQSLPYGVLLSSAWFQDRRHTVHVPEIVMQNIWINSMYFYIVIVYNYLSINKERHLHFSLT